MSLLANQPAAPRGDVLSDGTWIRTPEEEGGQPAAPTRTEAEQLRHDVDLLARAVCDIAMGVVSKNTVELHELARRGLK